MNHGTAKKVGPITLVPGIQKSHLYSYLFVAFFSTCMMAFINFIQPFLLTEYLNIPTAEQGSVSGNLVFYNELVIIVLVGLVGALSDKIGRSAIYAFGFLVVAAAYVLFPEASTLTELIWVRLFFAIGAACIAAMLATVMADYPAEESRGKLVGFAGIATGLGIMLIVFVLSKLPSWYQSETVDSQLAGRFGFWTVSAICVGTAIVAWMGLKRGTPAGKNQSRSLKEIGREGLKAGKNPKIALAYASSFVSRGDLAVVGTFLSLWVMQDGLERGLSSTEALKQAGMIFGISQGVALLWAPVIGLICDRLNRTTAMAIALFLAAFGYISLGFVDDPASTAMIIACVFVGIGEISGVIASQALIGEQAPAAHRGAVIGVFGFFGAIGILLATKIGGHLFDQVHPSAPFVAIGIVNGLVFIAAMVVRSGKQKNVPEEHSQMAPAVQ